jgi:signal transduction histidine kinase
VLAVALPGVALVCTRVLAPWMGPRMVLFALAVVAVGLYAGSRAALASTAISLVLVAFFGWGASAEQAYEGGYELVSLAAVALIGLAVAGVSEARERAEREGRRAQRQLLQAQKMEALGRLAGGIAHDFNNVLTAILGYADVAMSRLPPESDLRADLEEIQRAATRAATLTSQLLTFGRREPVAPVALDLHALVGEMEAMLRPLIGGNVELVTHGDRAGGRVVADPSQLGQVVMNLVLNARDAMPGGGKLEIRTERVVLGARDDELPPGRRPGAYVRLSVADTGVGIPEDARDQIFEPFVSTKGDGTGLGLSTVYGIARQSGGFVRVESEAGHGSVFQVYLPQVEGSSASRSPRRPGRSRAGAARPSSSSRTTTPCGRSRRAPCARTGTRSSRRRTAKRRCASSPAGTATCTRS